MSESLVLAVPLGLAGFAAGFVLAAWVAMARTRRQRRIASAMRRWYLDDLERGDMNDSEMLDGVQRISAEREDARRWAVRLEGELAAAQERASEDLEREHARWRAADARAVDAEEQRDRMLGRLATAHNERGAYRHQRDQAVAARDEAVAALADLLDEVIEDLEMLSMPARKARNLVERYRRPEPATIHATLRSARGEPRKLAQDEP